jgi:cytochrome c5
MKLTVINLKKLAVAAFALPLLSIALVSSSRIVPVAAADDFDAATTYKAKCAMCHGPDASKKFDATLADDVLVNAVLKGKDATPIKMPAFEAKGVTEDQAKALVAFMKSQKK